MTKTCDNCEHQRGGSGTFARCVRVGFFCSTEMAGGGRCAGPVTGIPEMNLWEPRRTIWMRIKGWATSSAAKGAQ
jgi:hypothetical protein